MSSRPIVAQATSLPRIALLTGVLALAVPTILSFGAGAWSSEAGGHAPLVLATCLWLAWREVRGSSAVVPGGLAMTLLILATALPIYVFGRITSIASLETIGLIGAVIAIGHAEIGARGLARCWFPILLSLFLIVPPANWLAMATEPIKIRISALAAALLHGLGYAVGLNGVTLQIDSYQLFVATACSGLNSLIGLSAIGLLYFYLRFGGNIVLIAVSALFLLPIAIAANFIRVVSLVLITHYWGDGVAQGVVHEIAGFELFVIALSLAMLIGELVARVAAGRRR